MAAITNGAELVRKLRETHTPPANLEPARAALRATHEEEGRVLSADEVIAALEAHFGPDHGTVRKALRVAATGEWTIDKPLEAPIEDRLLEGGDTVALTFPDAKPLAAAAVPAAEKTAPHAVGGLVGERMSEAPAAPKKK